jgi:hypothetical protein
MDLLVATNGYVTCLTRASCHGVPAMVVGTNGLPTRVTVGDAPLGQ